MIDTRITKLAEILINHSTTLKKGEKLYLDLYNSSCLGLGAELIRLASKKGAICYWNFSDENTILRSFFKNANKAQLIQWGKLHLSMMKQMDAYIGIRSHDNIYYMSDVPAKTQNDYKKYYVKPVHLEQRVGKTKWCVLRYPNDSMAQLAGMSTELFSDFYFRVCTVDYKKMGRAMDPLVKFLQNTKEVKIKCPGTNLTLKLNGIPVQKCNGLRNIPDGEVYTAPQKNSINGYITYNTPTVFKGKTFNEIFFKFENGKIVEAKSPENQAELNKILDIDEGARYIGEFAFGINPHINKPMKDTLFDEKIYGSIHLTPGNAYGLADNSNRSAIHWDLVLIQTKEHGGGEIYFDNNLIRKDGDFVHKSLKNVLSRKALT